MERFDDYQDEENLNKKKDYSMEDNEALDISKHKRARLIDSTINEIQISPSVAVNLYEAGVKDNLPFNITGIDYSDKFLTPKQIA